MLAGLAVLAVTAWAVAAVQAFRFPQVDPLGESDAYYALHSGGGVNAVAHHAEWLPTGKPLLVSLPADELTLEPYRDVCRDPALNVLCVHPDPLTTQGEAQNLGRIAREQGWRSVTVLSQRSHMTRARVLMERCFDGEVRMVPRDVQSGAVTWIRVMVYESAAMVKTWLTPGC